MITCKIEDILNLNQCMINLSQQKIKKGGGVIFFKLSLLSEAIKAHVNTFNETRKLLFERFGEPDAKQENQLIIPKDKVEEFSKEMDEVLNENIELNINKIDKSILDNFEISFDDFKMFQPFVK